MRSGSLAFVLVSSIATVALSSACADEEILLATVPPGRPGSPSDGQRCVDTNECPTQSFCARRDCGEIGGHCELRPFVCEDAPSPVCGCDGVTYWNDCLRRAAGATAMTQGECRESSMYCKGGGRGGPGPEPGPDPGPGGPVPTPTGCPTGTFCARLLPLLPPSPTSPPPPPDACPVEVPGTCWALPAVCPASGGTDRWTKCDPNAPNAGPCITTCEAIRSGEPHHRAMSCL